MKKYFFCFLLSFFLISCQNKITVSEYTDNSIDIWPDYKNVTVPCNIAPLSFSVLKTEETSLIVKAKDDSIILSSSSGTFNLPEKKWKDLLSKVKNDSIVFTVLLKSNEGWKAYKPFSVYVSEDRIDPYLVYRKIAPGYGLWNRMGIYQRCLESYEETLIYSNEEGHGNCINCHSFCEGNPGKWQVHIRTRNGGTFLFDRDNQSLLNLKDKSKGNPVYANWHPNGDLLAYSNNSTFFLIHTKKTNRWEVMDDASDVFVADIKTGEMYRNELISSPDNLETFPCFSPDGKSLYFCSANVPENVISSYDSIQYNLCRISFDPEARSFGNKVDTLFNAGVTGGSASFPRISPDGKFLCFTMSQYGNFSICHRDADLCLIDLSRDFQTDSMNISSFDFTKLELANSHQVESFHSWSRNSRWLVFSSKRDDAIYTRPYFVHIDENGIASKPFLLPQLDSYNFYDLEMECYNLPELVSGKISVEKIDLKKTSKIAGQLNLSVN